MGIKRLIIAALLGSTLVQLCSCDTDTGTVNVFTLEDDKQMGNQVVTEIESNPSQYPILDPSTYDSAYSHLNRMMNSILSSESVIHKTDFVWRYRIIRDDAVLNAFAAPGGKMYVYTGLIKFLDNENELAGVMGHEVAHADRRHVTEAMTQAYGLQLMLDIVLGQNQNAITQIASELATLKFSRSNESDADEHGVIYLNETSDGLNYDARGVGRFFEKLVAQGSSGNTPVFLSTHPDPENRVEDINEKWVELGSRPGNVYSSRYQAFKRALP